MSELEGPDGAYTTDPANARTRSRARFGYEGLRMFDVTDAANPRFLRFFRTACGSHTHTLAPDPRNGAVHAYVASYPLGSGITPQVDREQSDALGLTCKAPHQRISIVHIPLGDPEAGTVEQKALSSDGEPTTATARRASRTERRPATRRGSSPATTTRRSWRATS